ncbi:MAG: PilC/PilY family type IV pilus protein [Pseudomonadota bacterium]
MNANKPLSILLATLLLAGESNIALSAPADIANAPLITSPTSSVLPNVFLILDDSGSMGWDYMPDKATNFRDDEYGAASSQCNGVFYDPNITYSPPVDAGGASYPNSSFTAAWKDGFNQSAGTVNLSNAFRQLGGTSNVAAYYYLYSGAQTSEAQKDYYNTNSVFYKECNSIVGTTTKHDGTNPVNSLFTKVTVSSTSGPGATDERTNFANWYSYYRNRMLMMKTATGKAFSAIGDTFRVGYSTINNNNGSDILQLGTFDATQKTAWYDKLYAAKPSNSTPLREALADVGKMYANKLNSYNGATITDPMQYSCQQNFTILTTDGFWNGNAGSQLDGSAIGNQDYFEPRPMYDGASTTTTITTPYTTIETRRTDTTGATTVNTYGQTETTLGASCSQAGTTPNDTVTSLQDNSKDIWLGLSSTNPNTDKPSRCKNLAANAWLCRSGGNPVSESSVTDSNGTTWYLVSSANNLDEGTAGCLSDRTAFGSNYSSKKGACPSTPAVSGTWVTQTHREQTETLSGGTSSVVETYIANQETTQSVINGIDGPVSALTPTNPTFVFDSQTSSTSTPATSTTTSAWTTTSSTTTCISNSALPTAGVVNDTPWPSTINTGGTSTTTVLSSVGPTAGTPTTSGTSSGGTSDTLADVAEYYYITDLRTSALGNNLSGATGSVNGSDISENNVPASGIDTASHQHMTTFTLGLGARGRMVFDPLYESATSGDFYSVKKGETATTGVCSWQTSGSCNWPIPGDSKIENIDDLWHAAVNGRGTYFSATNPTGLATSLSSALAGVSARTGSASAATTSTAFITQGDNFLFRSTFVSVRWTGELIRQQINLVTGDPLSTIDWSAQTLLDANTSRNIYFYDSSATNKLASFTYANLASAGLNNYFDTAHIAPLSQLCAVGSTCLATWTASTPYAAGNEYRVGTTWYRVNTGYTSAATFGTTDTANTSVIDGPAGNALVNFLRGDRSREGAETDKINGKYFRQRLHLLGDIVNSESDYVKGAVSPFYEDPGHAAYKTAVTDRQDMVFVGANDGMLHAIYGSDGRMDTTTGLTVASGGISVTGGDEAWAYIPTEVMPNLYKLASKDYSNSDIKHQYYVDGSPVTADICISNCTSAVSAVWKTILVGGLNAGGAEYYALDITNPAQPKALWEFTDSNLGYTFGNPKVVKLKTGQWVVLLTSGYNNTAGDGKGYLYILDAYTGTLVRTIGTGAGDPTTPSNLGKLDARLATPGIDATATVVYAGDMLGNLWRFDINGDLGATGYDAQLIATLKDPLGDPQPITTKPLLSLVGTTLVVYIGTGRYLGSADQTDTQQQSFYAIKDTFPSGTTPSVAIHGVPRSGGFVAQTHTSTTCPVGTSPDVCTTGETVTISSNNAVNFASDNGWYFDFLASGERVNVDPAIKNGVLVINANAPNSSSCSVGGNGFQYQLSYSTGGALSTSMNGIVGKQIANELLTSPKIATLPSGDDIIYSQRSGGDLDTRKRQGDESGGDDTTVNGPPSRKSWRVLIQQ